jgi:hypothetical protein
MKRPPIDTLPLFCDFTCPHGMFAAHDAVGACRRDQAVYCRLLRSYVNKHSRCKVRNAAGRNAAGRNAAGRNAAGRNTTGRNAAGRNATGRNAASRNATGRNAAGRTKPR